MKRIAIFNRHFSRSAGGAESYSVAVSEGLAELLDGAAPRFEVHVFAQALPAIDEARHPKITYHKLAGPLEHPRWMNQLWFALSTWCQTRKGFDAVISHENTWHGDIQVVHVRPIRYNLFFPNHVALVGWRKAVRWLKILSSPRLAFYVWLEAARIKRQAGRSLVAVSQSMKDQVLVAYPHWLDREIHVILPGVAKADTSMNCAQARAVLGLPQDKTCLLFVGNDYARKGLPSLLGAMVGLSSDVHLMVVGNASQVPTFQLQAAELGVTERVHFLGALSSINTAYQAANILVHPTLEDSFAMVVLEAMIYGLPVVVSSARYCGISAFLQDGVNALLLDDPKDVAVLTQTLQKLLKDNALQLVMSQAGRGFAAEYTWSKAVRAYAAMVTKN